MRRPKTYTGIVRLPPPELTYQDWKCRRKGRWRRRPSVANQVFHVLLALAALAFVFGLLLVTPP
jgi:hypothetical protein